MFDVLFTMLRLQNVFAPLDYWCFNRSHLWHTIKFGGESSCASLTHRNGNQTCQRNAKSRLLTSAIETVVLKSQFWRSIIPPTPDPFTMSKWTSTTSTCAFIDGQQDKWRNEWNTANIMANNIFDLNSIIESNQTHTNHVTCIWELRRMASVIYCSLFIYYIFNWIGKLVVFSCNYW